MVFSSPTQRVLSFDIGREPHGSSTALDLECSLPDLDYLDEGLIEPAVSVQKDDESCAGQEAEEGEEQADVSDCSLPDLPLTSTRVASEPVTADLVPPPDSLSHTSLISEASITTLANSEKRKSAKKTYLMLRESTGGFQEIDEEEWAVSRASGSILSGTSEHANGAGGFQKFGLKEAKSKGKQRRVLRISQVEVLDMTKD